MMDALNLVDRLPLPKRRMPLALYLQGIRRAIVYIALFLPPSSFLLHSSEARAQDKYAGDFLQIPVGSRALSMGGAFTAIADDESAFHWNAAGVSLVPDRLVGFMYSAEYGAPGSALMNFYQAG